MKSALGPGPYGGGEMMKAPTIWGLQDLLRCIGQNQTQISDGSWVPARPLGFWSWHYRCRAAWLVFVGRADAVVWPGGQ